MKYLSILLFIALHSTVISSNISEVNLSVNGKKNIPITLKSKSHNEIVYEQDNIVLTVLFTLSKGEKKVIRLQKVEEIDLPPIIRFGEYKINIFTTDSLDSKDSVIFPITGLKGEKKYLKISSSIRKEEMIICLRNHHGIVLNKMYITITQNAIQAITSRPRISGRVMAINRYAKNVKSSTRQEVSSFFKMG